MAASFSDLPNNSWGMVLLQFSDTSSLNKLCHLFNNLNKWQAINKQNMTQQLQSRQHYVDKYKRLYK